MSAWAQVNSSLASKTTEEPFGLKSAHATYQRCVKNCLHKQIDRNVHAYVDDIVVKSRKKETLVDDLKETFDNLRTSMPTQQTPSETPVEHLYNHPVML